MLSLRSLLLGEVKPIYQPRSVGRVHLLPDESREEAMGLPDMATRLKFIASIIAEGGSMSAKRIAAKLPFGGTGYSLISDLNFLVRAGEIVRCKERAKNGNAVYRAARTN